MSLPEAVAATTAWALGGLAVLWLHYEVSGAWHRRRRLPSLYRCERCAGVYEDGRRVPLSACPYCGTLNEAVKR